MEFSYTARFLRLLRHLQKPVQEDVVHAIKECKDVRNHKKVALHKLHGKMKAYHAFSANFSYRIIVKLEKQNVFFMDVGTHDVYEKYGH